MTYQIREGRKCDIPSLADIERAADGLFPDGRIPQPGTTYPSEDSARAVRDGSLLVADIDRVVVGFAVFEVVERALHLWVLAVHPNFGRRGIGKDLVVAVIAQSMQRELTGVTLTTFADLKWNAPFYEKLGFRVLPREERNSMIESVLQHETASGMSLRVAMLYQNSV